VFQPLWVTEQCLAEDAFDCCGDEDLLPFQCAKCRQLFVLCYECDMLYTDLTDLSQRNRPSLDGNTCPQCGGRFGDNLFRDERHRVGFPEWQSAGLEHLLALPSPEDLICMLISSASQLAHQLSRGMRSSAASRLFEYRNLAESIAKLHSKSSSIRDLGREVAQASTLEEAIAWHDSIPDPVSQAYAVLGIADHLFPE